MWRHTGSIDHPCLLRLLAWVRFPLQMLTELARGDLISFYQNKLEGLHYDERKALELFRVRLCLGKKKIKVK